MAGRTTRRSPSPLLGAPRRGCVDRATGDPVIWRSLRHDVCGAVGSEIGFYRSGTTDGRPGPVNPSDRANELPGPPCNSAMVPCCATPPALRNSGSPPCPCRVICQAWCLRHMTRAGVSWTALSVGVREPRPVGSIARVPSYGAAGGVADASTCGVPYVEQKACGPSRGGDAAKRRLLLSTSFTEGPLIRGASHEKVPSFRSCSMASPSASAAASAPVIGPAICQRRTDVCRAAPPARSMAWLQPSDQ